MDLRVLRYFIACVEQRTINAAAQSVNLSQPALSKAIANLEDELGVKLLERHPRGVVPTASGQTLFRYAKMMEGAMRRALAEMEAQRGGLGATTIGVIPIMTELVCTVTARLLERRPGFKARFRVGFTPELIPLLLDGDLDFAVVMVPAEGPPPGLTIRPLLQLSPAVVVRNGHPLSRSRQPSLAELAEYPWLMPDYPPDHREIIHRVFLDAGIVPPRTAVEVSTILNFDALVRQSDLVTVVPSHEITRTFATEMTELKTDIPFPRSQLGIALREHGAMIPGMRVVIDMIAEECAQSGGRLFSHPGVAHPAAAPDRC
jgi:DNA-binding transcriptional LysR family regulator